MKPAKRLETVDTCVLEARLPAGSAAHGAAPGGYILMAQRSKAGLLGGAPPGLLHALCRHSPLVCCPGCRHKRVLALAVNGGLKSGCSGVPRLNAALCASGPAGTLHGDGASARLGGLYLVGVCATRLGKVQFQA